MRVSRTWYPGFVPSTAASRERQRRKSPNGARFISPGRVSPGKTNRAIDGSPNGARFQYRRRIGGAGNLALLGLCTFLGHLTQG